MTNRNQKPTNDNSVWQNQMRIPIPQTSFLIRTFLSFLTARMNFWNNILNFRLIHKYFFDFNYTEIMRKWWWQDLHIVAFDSKMCLHGVRHVKPFEANILAIFTQNFWTFVISSVFSHLLFIYFSVIVCSNIKKPWNICRGI